MKLHLPLCSALSALCAGLLLVHCGTTPSLPELQADGGTDAGTALRIDTAQLSNGIPAVPYLEQLQASGGTPPFLWSYQNDSTALAWLSLDTRGTLVGTPDRTGTGTLVFTVRDSVGTTATASIPLAVVACQEGATYPCETSSAGACAQGTATCQGGALGSCGALQPSTNAFACGEDCGACDPAGADRCLDGGTCACGDTGAACADGGTCCPGADCVDLASDSAHCKACGNDCAQGQPAHTAATCGAQDCAYACNGGFQDCNGDLARNAGDGCEINTVSGNPQNCGACGHACSLNHATPHCEDSTCKLTCNTDYQDCNHDVGDGCEARVVDQTAHCGASCQVCPGPTNGHGHASCASSTCGIVCDSGYTRCGNQCVNLQTDATHCGACSTVCPGPTEGPGSAVCSSGTCQITCATNYNLCGTTCVEFGTDDNCLSCGNTCAGAAVCMPETGCCIPGHSC